MGGVEELEGVDDELTVVLNVMKPLVLLLGIGGLLVELILVLEDVGDKVELVGIELEILGVAINIGLLVEWILEDVGELSGIELEILS